jgi:pilus assembly protein Flp/PilA
MLYTIEYEEGQGLVEYAIIIMLLALVVVGAVAFFGGALENFYYYIRDNIPRI